MEIGAVLVCAGVSLQGPAHSTAANKRIITSHHTHTLAFIHTYIHTLTHAYTPTHMHTYKHTHTHTHMYIHTHTYTLSLSCTHAYTHAPSCEILPYLIEDLMR